MKTKLKLIGCDGNAFSILAAARVAATKAKWSVEKISEFEEKAMSGDYDNLLATCAEYFDVY